MIYGSVCSGIEAATVAWHPLGWRPRWLGRRIEMVSGLADVPALIEAAE
ncbi:hypothetical protein VRZ08_00995 [Rhodopseudomonas sp. G2_2311]